MRCPNLILVIKLLFGQIVYLILEVIYLMAYSLTFFIDKFKIRVILHPIYFICPINFCNPSIFNFDSCGLVPLSVNESLLVCGLAEDRVEPLHLLGELSFETLDELHSVTLYLLFLGGLSKKLLV